MPLVDGEFEGHLMKSTISKTSLNKLQDQRQLGIQPKAKPTNLTIFMMSEVHPHEGIRHQL